MFKRAKTMLMVDSDGYTKTQDVSGDYCYEYGRTIPSRSDATRPLGQRAFHGATMRWTDESKAYILEINDASGNRILHLYDMASKVVTASVVVSGADIAGSGGLTWTPDGTANGKFLFSLSNGDIAVYDITLTTTTQSATRIKTISPPVSSSSSTLRGIYVNEKENDATQNELWAIYENSDNWFVFDFSLTAVDFTGTSHTMSGSMLTERAHPTKPASLAVVHESGDLLRVFVGNRAKWVYELHVRRGKNRFKECPWHMRNLQACCINRYLSSCTEKTRDECVAAGGTFMGPWKHWNSTKDLCMARVCGVDDITNPSLGPPTVSPLPNVSTGSAPTSSPGVDVKLYENPDVNATQWMEDLENLSTTTPSSATTWTSIYKGEGSAAWFTGQSTSLPFAVTFSGIWHVVNAGKYKIQMSCNDACALYIDGSFRKQRSARNEMSSVTHVPTLDAGNHHIFVTFWAQNSPWGLRMKFRGPDTNDSWSNSLAFTSTGSGIFTGGPTSPFDLPSSKLDRAVTHFETDDFDGLFFNRQDDDFDWIRGGKRTPSLWTGPNGGTRLTDKYIYAEVSGTTKGQVARLQSANFTLGTGAFFSINYSMYGVDVGVLTVDVLYDGTHKQIFRKSGNQGAGWEPLILDIGSDVNVAGRVVSFLFTYTTKGGTRGDVALDDFQAYLGVAAQGQSQLPKIESILPPGAGLAQSSADTTVAIDECTASTALDPADEEAVDIVVDDEYDDCVVSDDDLADLDQDGETTNQVDDVDDQLGSGSGVAPRARLLTNVFASIMAFAFAIF